MKKLLTIVACMAIATTAVFAQQKGEMTIGGNLGFGVKSNGITTTTKIAESSVKTHDATPSGSFNITPQFGYFVIDNLQLNVGLSYDMSTSKTYENKDRNEYFRKSEHKYTLGIGLNYFVKICNNFYYTPGFFYDFGGISYNQKEREEDTVITNNKGGFTTGLDLNIGQFEVKINKHCGFTLNVLDLQYDFSTVQYQKKEAKVKIDRNNVDFALASKIGFKYYF